MLSPLCGVWLQQAPKSTLCWSVYNRQNTDEVITTNAIKRDRSQEEIRRGAQIKNGRLIVSSIYTWFQEDFEDSNEGVIRHL